MRRRTPPLGIPVSLWAAIIVLGASFWLAVGTVAFRVWRWAW